MECFKITGSLSAVTKNDPEVVVCLAISKAGLILINDNIEDTHRVGNRGQTIVKFARRKVS